MKRYYLAIDIGASSGRHILGHMEDGKMVLEEIYRFPNGMQKRDGEKVWDIEALFEAVLAGMKKCRELGKIPVSVGIDTWAVDFVLLDKDDQRIGNAVAYRDDRTKGMDEEVYRTVPEEELYASTGIQKQIFNSIYQLMAWKKKKPEQLEKAETLLMIPDYLNFLLSGVKAQEYTNATTTQLVNPETGDWNRELTNAPAPFPGMVCAPCPDNCALGALCDIDPEKEKMCKEQYPDVPFFKDWKDMIASGTVDAIITTVPHYLHHEISIYAMEHGMNVLCEKPAGVRSKDVQKMIACAKAHPEVSFGIMFNQRTNKLYQKIKEIVASGELGEIRRSQWMINSWWRPDSYYQQSAWRATWGGEGGGVLVNQAPHQLDLWQWICGIPVKVFSKNINGCHRNIGVENDVTMLVEFANGATGTFTTCTHDAIGTDRLEIDLDGGKIVVDNSKTAHVYHYIDKEGNPCTEDYLNEHMNMMEVAMLTSGNGAGSKLYTEETFENNDGWGFQHTTVMQNFAAHILTGSPLLAPGEDGINGVNLANSSQLSAWTGREVSNPCDPEEYAAELNKLIEAEGKFPVRE